MPQAVAAWVGSALFAAAGTSTVGLTLAGVGMFASYAATYGAIAYGLAETSAKLSAQQEDQRGFAARDIVVGAAKVPQTIVYGKAWVGGALLYMNSRHDAGTKDNFTVYRSIAHTAHEVNNITRLMFDDHIVEAGDINWATGHVTGGTYYLTRSGKYAIDLERTLGSGTQTQSALLTAAFPTDYPSSSPNNVYTTPGWSTTTTAFRLFSVTAKDPSDLFYSGPPSRQLTEIEGHKVYDPRGDSTFPGGSGSQRLATPSTWVYSTNPALQAAHYLMIYMGVAGSRIDWTWIAAQADIADTLVVIPPSASPLNKEKRFTGNGIVSLANTHLQNLQAILSSMLGTLSKPSGLWRVNAAAYQTPDVTITDDDIIGDPQLKGGFGLADRYNSVTAIYVDPNAFAQEVDSLPVRDATFVSTRDNGFELPVTISTPFTNSETQAQRLAYMHLAQSDRQKIFTIGVTWVGLSVTIGTRVAVTLTKFNWSAKAFRCIGWKRGESAPFDLTLREDDSEVWDDPPIGAYSTRDAQGAVTPGLIEIPTPTAGSGVVGEVTVANANFEAGDWYWSPEGSDYSIVNDSGNAHQGNFVAKYVYATLGTAAMRNEVFYPCNPGIRVNFGGYVKTSGTPGGSWGWRITWYDSAKSEISSDYAVTATTSTSWQILTSTAIGPANTQFVRLETVVSGVSAGTIFFDDGFMDVGGGLAVDENSLPNLMPMGYGDFEALADGSVYGAFQNSSGTVTISTDQAWLGVKSIKVTQNQDNTASHNVKFSQNTFPAWNNIVARGNRRFLIIVSIYPSGSVLQGGRMRAYTYGGTGIYSSFKTLSGLSANAWNRIAFEVDRTGNSEKELSLQLLWENVGTMSGALTYYIDGLVMLDVSNTYWLNETNFPTDYRSPTGSNIGAAKLGGGAVFLTGYGSPESVVTAVVGSMYLALDGSTSTTLYIKTSGTSSTGWTAK